jgi:DNA (cytosine-5)-methyltransferase 1
MLLERIDKGLVENYYNSLIMVGGLSKLFSDSDSPYLNYRATENLFCEFLRAKNVSRVDCSVDAIKDKVGIGIKTFLNKNGHTSQKVAEFNKEGYRFRGKDPLEAATIVSKMRNERIEVTKRIYGLREVIYHCIVRDIGKIIIFECKMDLVNIGDISVTSSDKSSIHFNDGKNEYTLNLSKSTLYKKFKTENILAELSVNILDNPYESVTEVGQVAEGQISYYTNREYDDYIILPLFSDRGERHVPPKSGLNLRLASGRKRHEDEVEFRIREEIKGKARNFFPPRDTPFLLNLPDGQAINAKVCQDGEKAIMSNPNSALGNWILRQVLNINGNDVVTYEYLEELGIDSVVIYKNNSGEYSIDFKEPGAYDEFLQEIKADYRQLDWEENTRMQFKVGSLFAGVGGICLGFKNAKYKNSSYDIVWANEIDEFAAVTYRLNFGHELIEGDIEKIVRPDRCESEDERKLYLERKEKALGEKLDLLVGGFPCQAFSIAGERKGFDDHRGNLFFSIVDLIELLGERHEKPRALLLENVKNLQSHDNSKTFEVIKKRLEELGYKVKAQVLNTADFTDVPQNRERIFIACFLREEDANKFTMFDNERILNNYKTYISEDERKRKIEEIIDFNTSIDQHGEYYYTKEKYPHYFLAEEEYYKMDESERKVVRINLEEQITSKYEFYQVRRGMYVRMNKKGVCPTLTANMGTGGHNVPLVKVNDGIRKITPEEAFKLQGFPIGEGYKLPTEYKGRPYAKSYLYKQAGNAVTVKVIELIATEMLRALTE